MRVQSINDKQIKVAWFVKDDNINFCKSKKGPSPYIREIKNEVFSTTIKHLSTRWWELVASIVDLCIRTRRSERQLFLPIVLQIDVWKVEFFTRNSLAAHEIDCNCWSGGSSDIYVSNIAYLYPWWLQKQNTKMKLFIDLQVVVEDKSSLVKLIKTWYF